MNAPDRDSGQATLTNRKPSRELLNRLADNVRSIRKARGFTQEVLGASCGVTKNYISNIEQGTMNVTIATLETLAAGLACGEGRLLLRTDGDELWTPKGSTADPTRLLLAIGWTARVHRIEQGYSQDGFADYVSMHRPYYGAVERGEKNLQLATLLRLAIALGLRPSKLIEHAEAELLDDSRRVQPRATPIRAPLDLSRWRSAQPCVLHGMSDASARNGWQRPADWIRRIRACWSAGSACRRSRSYSSSLTGWGSTRSTCSPTRSSGCTSVNLLLYFLAWRESEGSLVQTGKAYQSMQAAIAGSRLQNAAPTDCEQPELTHVAVYAQISVAELRQRARAKS